LLWYPYSRKKDRKIERKRKKRVQRELDNEGKIFCRRLKLSEGRRLGVIKQSDTVPEPARAAVQRHCPVTRGAVFREGLC
jgi:hypothetical protein